LEEENLSTGYPQERQSPGMLARAGETKKPLKIAWFLEASIGAEIFSSRDPLEGSRIQLKCHNPVFLSDDREEHA